MTQFASSAAPTRYIDAAGVRYAYRRFGNGGRPLLSSALHRHAGQLGSGDRRRAGPRSRNHPVRQRRRRPLRRAGSDVDRAHGAACAALRCTVDRQAAYPRIFARRLSRAGHRDRPTGTGRAVDPPAPRRKAARGMDRPELLAIYTDGEMPMSESSSGCFPGNARGPDGRRIRRPPRRAHCRPRSAGRPRSRIRPAAGDDRVGELER